MYGTSLHSCAAARARRGCALSLALALGAAGCGGGQQPGGFERPPAPVSVVPAAARDVPVYLDQVGKAVAREVVAIRPQVSGRVTEIHFTDGADLHKGDVLFTIDPRPYRAEVTATEATLAQRTAALSLARAEFARVERLIGTKAISHEDFDTRKNAVDVSEAEVQQARAAVEKAKIDLDYCVIRSPIEGRAGQRLIDVGNVVTANEGTLLTIQRLDPIYADFTVTENDLTAVQKNMAAGTLKVEVRLPDDPGEPRDGALTFLDNAVQEGTGTVKLRATVPNADHRFWPGRFVNVRLILATLKGAVLVPSVAPQMSAKGPFVYVAKEDSTAELRPVTLGQRQGDLVVVAEGVRDGERVVVAGQLGVTPGGKLRVEERRAAEAPAGAAPSPTGKPS